MAIRTARPRASIALALALAAVFVGTTSGCDSRPDEQAASEEAGAAAAAENAAEIAAQLAILQDADAGPEARLRAIQELRELRATEAVPAIRPFLEHERSPMRVTAASALVALDDRPSRPQILKLAEDLSRDRDPQYIPILFIVADMGGPEAREYLRTVAEAHPAPAVRQVAADALKEVKR